MDDENIPDSIKKYTDVLGYEGRTELLKSELERQKALNHYKTEAYPAQCESMKHLNKLIGTNKQVDYEGALGRINAQYDEQTLNIAKQHGYVEPDKDKQNNSDRLRDLSSRLEKFAPKQEQQPSRPSNEQPDKNEQLQRLVEQFKKNGKDHTKGFEPD